MLTLSLVVGLAVGQPLVAWPVESGFVITDRTPRVVARVGRIDGVIPTALTVSADGSLYAAVLPPTGTAQMRLVLTSSSQPGVISSVLMEGSFFAAPSFSRDGKWLMFVHYPKGGGVPGSHTPGAFAQLFRVPVRRAGDPEQLTVANGCHSASASADGDLIYVVHSNCNGASQLERVVAHRDDGAWQRTVDEKPWSDRLGELDAWPFTGGLTQRLLVTRPRGEGRELIALDVGTGRAKVFAHVLPRSELIFPRWNSRGDAVLFQRHDELWLVTPNAETLALRLEKP